MLTLGMIDQAGNLGSNLIDTEAVESVGHRSYGFETAAQTYYGKSLSELTLAEHAWTLESAQQPLSQRSRGF